MRTTTHPTHRDDLLGLSLALLLFALQGGMVLTMSLDQRVDDAGQGRTLRVATTDHLANIHPV